MRRWTGPALLGFGFLPLFLLAGLWAVLAMVVWLAILTGNLALPSRFDPVTWHAHEFLWGYLGAVMGGFLLTAIPNWTGRLPIVGWPLAGLAGLWILGRLAIAFSAYLPAGVVAATDLAYPTFLCMALGREIVAGRNWRNLKVVMLLAVFAGMDAAYLWQAGVGGAPAFGFAMRGAVGVAVTAIALIGGRVVPSFTRNWLVREGRGGRLPAAFDTLDSAVMASTLLALLLWLVQPEAALTAAFALAAGFGNLARLARWRGLRCLSEPLVWILHAGFFFVPLGFLLLAASILAPGAVIGTEVLHAWLVGAIGVMTLAMMTRATLGHSGRPLHADAATTLAYVLVIAAALARVAVGFAPGASWLLDLAAFGWIAGFSLFVLGYAPLLARRPRRVTDPTTLPYARRRQTMVARGRIDFAALVVARAAAHRAAIETAGVVFSAPGRVPSGPVLAVQGDPVRLSQLLDLLFDDARERTPAGASLTVTLAMDDGQVALVIDNGPGASPAAMPPGGTARLAETPLARAQAIVEAHGGAMRAGTGPGRDARIVIHLPHNA